MTDAYLSVLELGYYEVTFAFEGLADENVWKRPAAGLLSVGELAGHLAYWEALRLAGEGGKVVGDGEEPSETDLSKCRVSSLLIDQRFAYHTNTIAASPSAAHLAMTAQDVCRELLRVHTEAVTHFKALNPELSGHASGWSPNWTHEEVLKYLAFHISYHTGQMFSARHLLGEATPDN